MNCEDKLDTAHIYVVEGFFGRQYGWEEVTAEDNILDIQQRLKEYRENDPQHEYRWRKRRLNIERESND